MTSTNAAPQNVDTTRGFVLASIAYLIWGILPFYLKAVAHIPPLEVVAHRVIWSVPIAAAVLIWQRRTDTLKVAIRTPSMLGMAAITAGLITVNWLAYIWAIGANRAIEASLGMYFNPLVNVFLGAIMLGETMSHLQKLAIGLAIIAVGVLAWDAGGLPWVSLTMAISWGLYAYFRKALPIGPNQGFLLEVLILAIPGLGYVVYLAATGSGHFLTTGWSDTLLLAGTGITTAVPLMVFGNAAKLLRLTTMGLMQYITPTLVFLAAVFAFHEPFGLYTLIAFGFIWCALAIYTGSALKDNFKRG